MNCYELDHTAKLTAILLLLQSVIHIIMFSINSHRTDLRVEQLTRIENLLEDIRFNGESVYDDEEEEVEEEEAEEAEEEAEEAEEESKDDEGADDTKKDQ
jgi:hypothetical protein